MIAACPRCSARYRIERERIKAEGVRLRCTRCQAAFRVRAPASAPSTPPHPTPTVSRQARSVSRDRSRLVVVADPDSDRAKTMAAALADVGIDAVLSHDGVEAILTIQRLLPRAVVVDAALPRMSGIQICELIKRNESLRSIGLVLLGGSHEAIRARRPVGEQFGADVYLELSELPSGLIDSLRQLGLPVQERPAPTAAVTEGPPRSGPEPSPPVPGSPPPVEPAPPFRVPEFRVPEPSTVAEAVPSPIPTPPSVAPAAAPNAATADAGDAGTAQAERLARIIVSDIVLYNERKFAAATEAGNVLEAMDAELEEGRALFRERIDARLREQRDFLSEEIMRVARSRGAS